MIQRKLEGFQKPIDAVVERMVEDQKQREQKRTQLVEQQKKNDEESLQKSMMATKVVQKTRTHEEFLQD